MGQFSKSDEYNEEMTGLILQIFTADTESTNKRMINRITTKNWESKETLSQTVHRHAGHLVTIFRDKIRALFPKNRDF